MGLTSWPTGLSLWCEHRLRGLAWANLIANVGIVATGGAVRLTASGLGCPTWPRCTPESFTPHGAMDINQYIEFGNRMLTFVLVVIAVLTYLGARAYARRRQRLDIERLALIAALGIPLQAVIGGISVLVELNPWVVGLHMVVSLAIAAVATMLIYRLHHEPTPLRPHSTYGLLAAATLVSSWLVFYTGTVVTGAGPHAGDADAPRNGLDTLETSQLHADLVFLLVGLTIASVIVLRGTSAHRAAKGLLSVELAQGLLGFVQYFTGLPIALVGLHMVGSAITSAMATWLLLAVLTHESSGKRGNNAAPLVTSDPAGN